MAVHGDGCFAFLFTVLLSSDPKAGMRLDGLGGGGGRCKDSLVDARE